MKNEIKTYNAGARRAIVRALGRLQCAHADIRDVKMDDDGREYHFHIREKSFLSLGDVQKAVSAASFYLTGKTLNGNEMSPEHCWTCYPFVDIERDGYYNERLIIFVKINAVCNVCGFSRPINEVNDGCCVHCIEEN